MEARPEAFKANKFSPIYFTGVARDRLGNLGQGLDMLGIETRAIREMSFITEFGTNRTILELLVYAEREQEIVTKMSKGPDGSNVFTHLPDYDVTVNLPEDNSAATGRLQQLRRVKNLRDWNEEKSRELATATFDRLSQRIERRLEEVRARNPSHANRMDVTLVESVVGPHSGNA